MSTFAFVVKITLESNVFATMINSIAALIASPMVFVCKAILVDRLTSFVFVLRVLLVDNVNSTVNLFPSLSINSSRLIFSLLEEKRHLLYFSSSLFWDSSSLSQIISSRLSLFVVRRAFVEVLVIISFG